MAFKASKLVTIFVSMLIFTGSLAHGVNSELYDFYEADDRFDFFLTNEKANQCDELFGDWSRTLRMCYRTSSRDERMTVDKIRACNRNFYYVYDIRNCLKFAPLLEVSDINNCGKTPTDRYRPMMGMTCIGNAVGGTWPLEYEERIFND